MKLNPFALAAAGIGPEHPLDYNIAVPLLPLPFAEAIVAEINAGAILYYFRGTVQSCAEPLTTAQAVTTSEAGLMPWIKQGDAAAVLAVLQDAGDVEADQIYIPPRAYLPISYFLDATDREAGVLTPDAQQIALLSAARQIGALEERLNRLPSARFNIALDAIGRASPLRIAAEQGRLRVIWAGGQAWVSEEDIRALLGPNDNIDDIDNVYWVPRSARGHRVALERELAALRSQWPEVFEYRIPIVPRFTEEPRGTRVGPSREIHL